MGSDDIFDILLLVLVLAILTPIMVTNSIPLFRGNIGGFDTLIDKTARKTAGEINPAGRPLKREDVVLMTIIADRRTPKPGIFQARADIDSNGSIEQSPDITTNDILTNRGLMLQTLYNYTVNGDVKLEAHVDSTGIERWVFSPK